MASVAILARHGRTLWNTLGRIQGHQGAELDEVGQEQARSMAQQLLAEHPTLDLIVSSDLLRASQTAEIVAALLRIPIQHDPRLRECAFGSLEGLTAEQVIAQHGQDLVPHLRYRGGFEYDFRPFGGECLTDVIARQATLLDELRANIAIRSALLIGHGRAFNNLLTAHWPTLDSIENNCEYRVVTL